MSGSTVTYAAGKSHRTMCRCGPISISRRPKRCAQSVPAALHPVLEHLQRRGTIIVGRFSKRPVVAFLDPDFVRARAVTRERQPHQAARGLPRQPVAVEQHLAEQGLRLMLALLRGKAEPARAIGEII